MASFLHQDRSAFGVADRFDASHKIHRKPLASVRVEESSQTTDFPGREQDAVLFLQEEKRERNVYSKLDAAPRRLGRYGFALAFNWGTHLLMCLLITPFFMLVGIVTSLHGELVKKNTLSALTQSSQAASTLFTMVFAAVVGQALRKYATWLLQRGTTVGRLDHLMQSRTVISAFTTSLALRTYSPWGLGLLLLWALSPIGSQSSLRILSTSFNSTMTSQLLYYVDTTANDAYATGSSSALIQTGVSTLYNTGLLGPSATKNGSMDFWSNVKIPFLSQLRDQSSDGWYLVPKSNDLAPIYSSLLGIPTSGLPDAGNASFSLETTYIDLACTKPIRSPPIPIAYDTFAPNNGTFRSLNNTRQGQTAPSWSVSIDNFVENRDYPAMYVNDTDMETPQSTILYQSKLFEDNVGTLAISYCKVTQEYVESRVACEVTNSNPNCSVVAQRASTLPHALKEISYLSLPVFGLNFIGAWMRSEGMITHSATSSLTEWYIQDPSASSIRSNHGGNWSISYDQMPTAEDFSIRLGQLLNTFLLASQTYQISSGDPLLSDAPRSADHVRSPSRQTNSTIVTLQEVYTASWGWVVGLLLASLTMLAAVLFGIWCELRTTVPDILGWCSSLTRDSRYLDIPGGGTLDGVDRTAVLHHFPIRLGVVDDCGGGSGRLAVASPEIATEPVRGKFYR